MRRFAPAPRRNSLARLVSGITIAVGLALTTISAQIPGRNVNMVAGNTWPDGDPYLQRQNEPSIGASTRNPLHLLAGANDYRTVDVPGLTDDEVGDAWLGLFKSYDGGQRWTSTLLPGYPQDQSAVGQASPIHGYGAGADPVVRAGTNGLMYYAGLVFDRANPATPDVPGKSAIFVARYIDNNNKEAGDTFEYLGTRALQTDPGGVGGNFLDKPWMVVDVPRDASRCTIVTAGEKGPITQSIPAGPIYVAYTLRSTDSKGPRYDVMFTRSADCGSAWTTPVKLNSNSERANQGAALAIDPRNGDVYIAWRQFDVSTNGTGTDALMAAKFTLAGKKLDPPGFARKFAKPKKGKGNGLNLEQFYKKGGVNRALEAAELSPLDQSTSAAQIRFRTNAYPSMAIDETGRVYMAFAERGYDPLNPDPVLGSARVLVTTSLDGRTWTAARAVNEGEPNQKGHQLMPSLTYAGGRLVLIYYDIRQTRAQAFTKYIDDRTAFQPGVGTGLRHTIDLRASMASPRAVPAFAPSVPVSEYIEGPRTPGGPSTPWQVNPPNLPMFQKGTAPFIGDYVDIAAAPNFVINAAGQWVYNSTAGSTPPIFHAVWTDNRDVRVPLHDMNGDGNPWNDYVPPGAPGGAPSIFDPTRTVPMCIPGNAGSRNQNVYTARITGGLLAGSPGNTKRLGYRLDGDGNPTTALMERSFVVFAQNTGDVLKRFRFTITNQPVGGRASFDQFSAAPLTAIEADIPYRSTASRTVYASSTDPHAIVSIAVEELALVNGVWIVKTGGLGSVIVLNPDIDNPDIDNPDIDNPDIDNPDIDNVEVYNPDIDNPDIDNPDIDNPDIDNPDIDNPDIDNVDVANPDIDNPDIDNPDIDNPDIDNPDIDNPDIDNPDIDNTSLMTDISWSMTNTGNTTASYNVNLFFAQQAYDPSIKTQLILYRTYKTPVVVNCELKSETRNVLVANVPNPQLVTGSTGQISNPNDPAATNATIYLAPGESAKITLRVFDPSPAPGSVVTVTNRDGSTALVPSQFVPNEDVTPIVQQQSVNTADVDEGVVEPPVVVQFPPPQTVPDAAATSENTPVKLNVLANDSTAFGSTKVISFHPAGMAAHSGGPVGDITYQPSTGFLYTGRGAIDPLTSTLVARFPAPPGGFGMVTQQANTRNGINYGRTGAPGIPLIALDARPDSPTFHTYLPMPSVSATDSIFGFAIDAPHNRIYVAHGPSTPTTTTPTTVSVIAIGTAGPITHSVISSISLPVGVRAQTIAVNTRTQRVYLAASGTAQNPGVPNTSFVPGGVFMIDMTAAAPSALRIPNTTQGAYGLAVNESANLIYASSAAGPSPPMFTLYAIDGATNAATSILSGMPMRFGSNDERLAVHESSGKVYMRLQNSVVVIDGKRGSPTRNTVLATIAVGADNGAAELVVDQQRGVVVTVGSLAFQADVIDVASNAILTSIPLATWALDVALDPINHRAFLGVFTHVVPVDLAPAISVGVPVPVFIESGSILLNPMKNKGYAGLFSTRPELAVVSGAGYGGTLSGDRNTGRYLYSEWHSNTNRGYIVSQGNGDGTSGDPGSVAVVDGATETVLGYAEVPANPFGIGIDQVSDKVYVATLASPNTHGRLAIIDANSPETDSITAPFTAAFGATYPAFPLNGSGALLGFGRHVVPNPVNHKVYVLQIGGSATSVAVFDPLTNVLKPLDGIAGSPLFDAQAAAGENWGRAQVIRVHRGLNRVFLGFLDAANVGRIVALDSATDSVVGSRWLGGSHSNRHTAGFVVVNEADEVLYVTDYTNSTVTKLDARTLTPAGPAVPIAAGPSAMAYNAASNRLYVSSIDTKTLSAVDGHTLQVLSTVTLPLSAYFLWVDEIESRIYTSGGDSADESGVMVITDVLGQLGASVSVTSVGNAQHGTAQLNPDNSVTYTPAAGYFGPDSFTYNIAAPTGTAIGTVHINVVASAPAAIALGDGYSTTAGQLLTVPAPGPLANDSAPNSPGMSVQQPTTNGTLTPQQDGSFTYQPNPGFIGVDSFTYYAVDDALGNSNLVTVTITVNPATDLVVTNTSDSGVGSLRQALINANLEPGATVRFNITTGAAPYVIQPASALPVITAPITIDGYTQPGASYNTLTDGTNAQIRVQLNGTNAGSFVNGLTINGGGTTVRGLAIGGFAGSGILLDLAGGNVIEGNFIGTNTLGTTAMPNGGGIMVQSGGNMIGGNTTGARNLISGNTNRNGISLQPRHQSGVVQNDGSGTVIKGNLIGTKASGVEALPNNNGISVSVSGVVIGGALAADRNVISGNTQTGITAFASTFDADFDGNTQTTGPIAPILVTKPTNLAIRGNYIGLGADGSTPVQNATGIQANAAQGATIIGNVIAGYTSMGISLGNSFDSSPISVPANTIFGKSDDAFIQGNYIGLDASGTTKIAGNAAPAVFSQARNTTIGGPNPGDGNFIVPGNGSGISLQRHTNGATLINAAGFSTIQGNVVGLNVTGARMNGGGSGSAITIHSGNNQILNNIVSGNGVIGGSPTISGITLFQAFATNNLVKGNIVGTNAAGAAGLGNTARGIVIQDASGNTIGGTSPGDRNIVVDNRNYGISLDGTSAAVSGNVVQGNYVGVKADGVTALGNTGVGINLFANSTATITGNTIAGNVIAGNTGDGMSLGGGTDGNTNNNTIAGNYLGVAADGVTPRGNGGHGIFINNARNNTIGGAAAASANIIANNGNRGVVMQSPAQRNKVLSNRIFANAGLGIDLGHNGVTPNDPGDADSGANDLQNYPVITALNVSPSATEAQGTLDSAPNTAFTLQLFRNASCDASGNGEGEELRDTQTIVTGPTGQGFFTLTSMGAPGGVFTVTATDPSGNTSEFSACNPAPNPTLVSNLNDSGPGSLRQAILAANSLPGVQTITFNIPGVNTASPGVITLNSGLPPLAESVVVDGATQPTYDGLPVIEVRSGTPGSFAAFAIQANSVTIRGLAITRFWDGIVGVENYGYHTIEDNMVGTNRANTIGIGNFHGIDWRANLSTVRNNVISGNSVLGMSLSATAAGNQFDYNKIGVGTNGVTSVANGGNGVTISNGPSGNTFVGNVISANAGWGVELLNSGNPVTATHFRANKIGLTSASAAAGNGAGGIKIDNAPSVTIGGTSGSGLGNVIAFNNGVGLLVLGSQASVTIRENHFYGNAGLGIDLGGDAVTANDGAADDDNGPNGLQNFVPLLEATNTPGPRTSVTFDATPLNPGMAHTIEFFSSQFCDPSGHGEGASFEGSTVVNGGAGTVTFMLNNLVGAGVFITATARDSAGNTSEFSNCTQVIEDPVTVVGPAGGNGGSAFAAVDCPAGSVVIAFAGRAGDDIDQTQIVCAPEPALTPPTTLFVAGGNGGADYGAALSCGAGEAVTGVFGATRGGQWIDYLGVTCTNLVTLATHNTGTVGLAQSPVPFTLSCPAGKQVIGVEGRQGMLLDQISIRCK